MKPRILIVDDEESAGFGMREYFAELGYSVDCARDREEALDLLAGATYSVVIVDLQLSGVGTRNRQLEGLEVTALVRREYPGTRVLVLTASGPELEPEAHRRGADSFLQKPQPLARIAEVVEMLHKKNAVPQQAEAPRDGNEPELAKKGTAARKKVLLVDDSSTVLLMERTLLARNYDVISACDGREAVERALAEKPDLILMDVIMPRMGGLEAVQRLRSDPGTTHIPIIMVTTRGELKSVESGYESGCNDYVTKPFSAVELLAKVKSCLGG